MRFVRMGLRLMSAVLLCLVALPGMARAQGDGPRAWLFAPDGINAISFTWMELSSNYNFAGDILIPNADIDSDVEALAYIRYFNLGGRFAQAQVTGIFGGVGGTGPGFSPEALHGARRPFFTTKGPGNLGLGLALVDKVVQAHGGTLSFRHGERGARVAVTLPSCLPAG